jgi:hypothetical protein
MIELTEEQRRELEQPEPVVVDPVTKEEYVLVRREAYARLKAVFSAFAPGWDDPKMDEYDRYEDPRR